MPDINIKILFSQSFHFIRPYILLIQCASSAPPIVALFRWKSVGALGESEEWNAVRCTRTEEWNTIKAKSFTSGNKNNHYPIALPDNSKKVSQ